MQYEFYKYTLKFLIKNKKTLSINIIILLVFITFPSFFLFGYRISKKLYYNLTGKNPYKVVNYPIYKDKKKAFKIHDDYAKLNYKYRSYMGWRTKNFRSGTINIEGKYSTRLSTGNSIENSTWFFGGSTLFGYGSSDQNTIPSLYNQITGKKVLNFGDTGWHSRQSLNQLLNVIGDGHIPEEVIFYEGANDIGTQCRSENSILPTHAREKKIIEAINESKNIFIINKNLVEVLIEPYKLLSSKILKDNNVKFRKNQYDCDKNNSKGKLIAQHIVNNWYTAYLVSKAKGFNFYAILEPSLFTTGAEYSYFNPKVKKNLSQIKKQHDIVYPLVIKQIKKTCKLDSEFCNTIFDGRKWISPGSQVYFDAFHFNKEGNRMIIKRLLENISKLNK